MPKDKLNTELIDKQEIEIEKVSQEELNKREEGIPHFKEKVELTDEQIRRLKEEIFKQFEALKIQKKDIDTEIDNLEAQYDGEMSDDAGLEFSFDTGVTKIKVNRLEEFILKALLQSDPMFTVTPRPAMAKMDKWNITVERQADYLDYKLDEEIDIISPLRKVVHQAVNLKGGILKIPYSHQRKKRKREERYSGKVVLDEETQQESRPGLEAFLRQYPDAINPGNEGHWVLKDLEAEKDVVFMADFWETVYSDPLPSYVDCRDFFVDKDTEGYQGLCDGRLIIERQRYSWWELKKAEKNGDFENIDACKARVNDDGTPKDAENQEGDYKMWQYEVLECVYWFNQKEDSDDPDDEIRVICWFELNSKAFLGAILYPYYGLEVYYIPFYIKNKKAGFWKGGLSEDITNDHLIQNTIINLMLTESWQQLMTTPIVRQGSPIADQFIHKRWKPGIPLEVPQDVLNIRESLTFLDRPQRGVAAQLMNVIFFMGKIVDDKSGIQAGMSGKESPTDPRAPASKTAQLMQQAAVSIGEYIDVIVSSFNIVGEAILQLTYQMSQSGRMYRQRQKAGMVTGGDPFVEISRDEMIAKTNIQSRATAFAFDKLNEKRENLALYQLLRSDPILSQNPEGVYALAKTLVESWSPLWKNKVDKILPNPQEFQMNQFKMCIQALQAYLGQMSRQKEVTGVKQQPKFEEFMEMAGQMAQEALTPTEEK